MKHIAFRVLALCAAFALGSLLAVAQGVTATSLSGAVVDQTGSAVAGADVLVKEETTGLEFKTSTAGNGTFSSPFRYGPTDGEVLYKSSCQACHMPAGEGAQGAGAYPALAKNTRLRTSRYITGVVVNGQKGMPPFGPMMNDEQVAAVVNYVRTHLGNDYKDLVSAADVKALRR